jgi:small subunit ribosomal protein S11
MADAKDTKDAGPKEGAAKPEKAPRAAKKAEAKETAAPGTGKDAAPAEAAGGEGAAAVRKAPGRKKERKNVPFAICNVHASFNNTVISISDQAGNVLSWSSAGCIGFKGSRKGTPFAAQLAAQAAGNTAKEHGVRRIIHPGPAGDRARSQGDQGRHADPAQRLPPAETPARLRGGEKEWRGHVVRSAGSAVARV